MTAKPNPQKVKLAGALSNKSTPWQTINWVHHMCVVNRLQIRISKAAQAKRWNKVKALQHLLTHSYSGKILAVRKVTENAGKKTAGVDKVTWSTPEAKAKAIETLRRRGYKPLPLKRIYIPKRNGSKRPLSIPTMKDRAMQALYLQALDPVAEVLADPNSYGFRKERCAADAIEQCFKVLCKPGSAVWILEGDIKSCFDKINHEWLLSNSCMDKLVLNKWLKSGYIEKNVLFPTIEGTPQGGICSPVLANITLDGLERELYASFRGYPKRSAQKITKYKVNFIRYADDFIITGSSEEVLENRVKPIVENFLSQRGLTLSKEKTKITSIDKGFDFLGFNVRKYEGKLLIKPSKASVKSFCQKIRDVISGNKQATAYNLIWLLNPIIRGWSNYYKHVVSSKTFKFINMNIFKAIWKWCTRRHPDKSRRWVYQKYFRSVGNRNWVFFGQYKDKKGKWKNIDLIDIQTIKIVRYVKIKSNANPYDIAWKDYFEKRNHHKMVESLKENKPLLSLFNRDNGLCSYCQQPITLSTTWHNHHIVMRSKGGSDSMDNRQLLHPTCHRQIHSRISNSALAPYFKGVVQA